MRLTVLGCAGSFPGPESACSAYLVEAEGFRLLIDFGSVSMSALQRYTDMHSVDAIILTHRHVHGHGRPRQSPDRDLRRTHRAGRPRPRVLLGHRALRAAPAARRRSR